MTSPSPFPQSLTRPALSKVHCVNNQISQAPSFHRLYENSFQGPELANEEELREKLKELQARGAQNWAAEEVQLLENGRVTSSAFNCRCLSTWKALAHFRESSPTFWMFSTTVSKAPMTRYYIECFVTKSEEYQFLILLPRPPDWSMG